MGWKTIHPRAYYKYVEPKVVTLLYSALYLYMLSMLSPLVAATSLFCNLDTVSLLTV